MTDCFDQMTPAQKNTCCNGCGGKGGSLRPPHWFGLEEDCNWHDWMYYLGGTKADRLVADRGLHDRIQRRADGVPLWKRWYYRLQAWIYYRAVRLCGGSYFSWRDKPLDCTEALAGLSA
jgi:hypothetical protein